MSKKWFRESRGASLVEYAIILAFVAALAVGALFVIGMKTTDNVDHPVLTGAFM